MKHTIWLNKSKHCMAIENHGDRSSQLQNSIDRSGTTLTNVSFNKAFEQIY